jgi:hypothetical protein
LTNDQLPVQLGFSARKSSVAAPLHPFKSPKEIRFLSGGKVSAQKPPNAPQKSFDEPKRSIAGAKGLSAKNPSQ